MSVDTPSSSTLNNKTTKMISTLTGSVPEDLTPLPSLEEIYNEDSSFMGTIQNHWVLILLVIFGLAFLGINIFSYLSEGTQAITETSAPILYKILQFLGLATLETTRQTVNVSATGAKAATDVAAGTVTSGIDVAESVAPNLAPNGQSGTTNKTNSNNSRQYAQFNQMQGITSGKRVGQHVSSLEETEDSLETDALGKALTNAAQNAPGDGGYKANDSYSSVQTIKAKAGWCYIGDEKGVRNCIEVGENDQCMSGSIFPTSDVCINPSLRA